MLTTANSNNYIMFISYNISSWKGAINSGFDYMSVYVTHYILHMCLIGYFYLIGITVGWSPFSLRWLFWHQEALWYALAASLNSVTLLAFGFFIPLHLFLAVRRHAGDVWASVFECVGTCVSLRRTMRPKAVVSGPPWWLLLMSSQVSLICWWKGQRFLIMWARMNRLCVHPYHCVGFWVYWDDCHVVCSCVDNSKVKALIYNCEYKVSNKVSIMRWCESGE